MNWTYSPNSTSTVRDHALWAARKWSDSLNWHHDPYQCQVCTASASQTYYTSLTPNPITVATNQANTAIPSQQQPVGSLNGVAPLAPEGFNKYINASDMLEEFIAYLGTQKVRKSEVMGLPLELFVKWLILRACEADGEEAPEDVQLQLPSPKQARCLGCQRFLPAGTLLPLHDARCMAFYDARQKVAA